MSVRAPASDSAGSAPHPPTPFPPTCWGRRCRGAAASLALAGCSPRGRAEREEPRVGRAGEGRAVRQMAAGGRTAAQKGGGAVAARAATALTVVWHLTTARAAGRWACTGGGAGGAGGVRSGYGLGRRPRRRADWPMHGVCWCHRVADRLQAGGTPPHPAGSEHIGHGLDRGDGQRLGGESGHAAAKLCSGGACRWPGGRQTERVNGGRWSERQSFGLLHLSRRGPAVPSTQSRCPAARLPESHPEGSRRPLTPATSCFAKVGLLAPSLRSPTRTTLLELRGPARLGGCTCSPVASSSKWCQGGVASDD